MSSINIVWMYPDALNLHGDRGNLQAMVHVANLMGLEAKVTKVVNPADPIDFENADLLFFNPGELKVCSHIIEALKGQKDRLDAYIENGGTVIAIGTSGVIFGGNVKRLAGGDFSGLGYLKTEASERRMILGNDLHVVLPDGTEVMGSQIQMAEYTVDPEQVLAKVLYGHGNRNDGTEGARRNNLIWTNLLGPVMVKNPWWAAQILASIAERKGIEYHMPGEADYGLERASLDAMKAYIELKKEKKD